MAKIHVRSSKATVLLACSVIMNVLLLIGSRKERFERRRAAAEEAEKYGSISSCSGHGRAFSDGLLGTDGKPVCECNACFGGVGCSEPIPYCQVDADSGDPMFLEPFWLKNAASSAQMIPGWHRMSYEFGDGSLVSRQLKVYIERLHSLVGNANTKGRYIIFGGGATHLLNAAVHALSSTSPNSRVVASIPYYPVYKEQTEFFGSKDYNFGGDTFSINQNLNPSENYIEFVTSPNNPDGQLKKAILKGELVKTIHDLAYYWPHFTPIPAPLDEDLMIFTLSKLTGHAGSRFGWAVIRDKVVYEKMLTYMSLSTYGVPRETQLRVLKLLKVVLKEGDGREMFDFGFKTMRYRWRKLSKTLSKSTRFSLQQIDNQYCSFSNKIKGPSPGNYFTGRAICWSEVSKFFDIPRTFSSPAFAWVKCERDEDKDCYETLRSEGNLTGRRGSLFGAENGYVRLSLVQSQDEFNLLLERMQMLVNQEQQNVEEKVILLQQHNKSKGNTSFKIIEHPHDNDDENWRHHPWTNLQYASTPTTLTWEDC